MKWNQIFNRGKRAAQAEASGSLHSLLLPSVLGIAVCMLTLCSLTWAWFTATVNTSTTTIQSANIAVHMYGATAVEPSTNEDTAEAFAAENGLTLLEVEKKYTVQLTDGKIKFTMNGNAKMAYLEIQVGNGTALQYTDYLEKNVSDSEDTIYAIALGNDSVTSVFVTLKWGPHPASLDDNYDGFLSITTVPDEQDQSDENENSSNSGGEPDSNGEPGGTGDSSETIGTGNAGGVGENGDTVGDTNKTDNSENKDNSLNTGTENTNNTDSNDNNIGDDSTSTETGSDGAQQTASDTPATPAA